MNSRERWKTNLLTHGHSTHILHLFHFIIFPSFKCVPFRWHFWLVVWPTCFKASSAFFKPLAQHLSEILICLYLKPYRLSENRHKRLRLHICKFSCRIITIFSPLTWHAAFVGDEMAPLKLEGCPSFFFSWNHSLKSLSSLKCHSSSVFFKQLFRSSFFTTLEAAWQCQCSTPKRGWYTSWQSLRR